MNELTRVAAQDEGEIIAVLQNSLYPGAKPDSIRLVLAWCRANGRDPMKKPIHIVPTSVKGENGQYSYRDVLMPGIGTYRTDAAKSGDYVGKSEPEFGPDVTSDIDGMAVTHPAWCRVTVQRWAHGAARSFTAREMWIENYAAGKGGKGVNDMWRRRAYGQLAKCTEAQALRMAFPDETGNTNTAEEMEGKTEAAMPLRDAPPRQIEATAEPPAATTYPLRDPEPPAGTAAKPAATAPAPAKPNPAEQTIIEDAEGMIADARACRTLAELADLHRETQRNRVWMTKNRPLLATRIDDAFTSARNVLETPVGAAADLAGGLDLPDMDAMAERLGA